MTENENVTIEETKNYELFKKHNANRQLSEKHVLRMMKAIDEKNLLKYNPVIVDKNYNVIDGQHRVEACKRLGLPVPHIKSDMVNVKDIKSLNVDRENWKLEEWLNFYCNQELIDYQMLQDFMEKQSLLKVGITLELLHGTRSSKFHDTFKRGEYKYPEEDQEKEAIEKQKQINEIISYIKLKTSGAKTYLDRVTFYASLIEFFNNKSFDYKTFMKKLEYKINLIHPCQRQTDYVQILKEIYNFKNQSPME